MTARCSRRASSPASPPANRCETARWPSCSSSRTTASRALSISTTRSSSRTAWGTTGRATSACGTAGRSQPAPAGHFTNVETGEVDGNTIIDSATIDGSHSLVYDKNWDRTDKIRSIGWRNELEFSDQWKGTLDLGYSRADRDETYIQSVARANAFSSFDFTNRRQPVTSWSTPQDLTDPAVVQLTNDPNWAEMRTPKFKDEIKSAQLAVNRSLDWGWFSGLDAGYAYNQRDKDVSSDAFYLELTGPSVDPVTGLPLQVIPTDALRDPVMIDLRRHPAEHA